MVCFQKGLGKRQSLVSHLTRSALHHQWPPSVIPWSGVGLITSRRGIRAGEQHQWLRDLTCSPGWPVVSSGYPTPRPPLHHLLPTDRCSPNSRPALLWRVSGLACGYFCTQPPTHALVAPGDAAGGSQCWLLGHSRGGGKRDLCTGAAQEPALRLPVKLVSTRRLSLAPVSPHQAGGARARGISTAPEKLEWGQNRGWAKRSASEGERLQRNCGWRSWEAG